MLYNNQKYYEKGFIKAVEELIIDEGGYVNDKNDRGGETKFGISKKTYPHLNIKLLTKDEAIKLYYYDFWLNKTIENIENEMLKAKFFNISVNVGYNAAIKCLQRSIRNVSNNKTILKVDGITGKQTIKALKAYSHLIELYYAFKSEVAGYYRSLNNKYFIKGWLNRCYKK